MPENVLPKAVIQKLKFNSTVLAFDYGLKRIGVAIGNVLLKESRPLTVIHWKSNAHKWEMIGKLMKEWQPAMVVVGLPMHDDGNANSMTPVCKNFAEQLKGRYCVHVQLVDERFSSVEAESMTDDDVIDDIAAQIILDQWLREIMI